MTAHRGGPPRPPRREHVRPYTYGGREKDATSQEGCGQAIGDCQDRGDGRCSFCGRRIAGPPPAPKRVPPTRLGEEYRRHYDPDYGSGPYDT